MAKLVTHKFVSAIPDGDDATIVRPSNWNDTHDVSGVAESGVNTDITSMTGITGGISSPDYIQFDTTYATALTAGQLGWDGNDTLAVGMAGGNVIQHIGEDQFIYIKADAAITKGQVIMFTGAVGASGVLTGAPATGVTNPQYIMGVAAEDLAHNAFGLVQTFGELTGLNTNAFNEGDVLYYDSAVAGGLTSTFPATGPIVTVASVAKKSGGSGVLVIRVTVTQRITAGTGATITQALTGTTVAVTNPYNPASVAITGGTINGTTIGATTPSSIVGTTITGQTGRLNGTGQNLIQWSENLTNSPWSGTNTTASIVSTPFAANASQLVQTGSGQYNQSSFTVTGTVLGKTFTFSAWIWSTTDVGKVVALRAAATSAGSGLNLPVTLTATPTRHSVTFTFTSSDAFPQIVFDSRTLAGADGLSKTFFVWGAQIELSSTLGNYVATTTAVIYGTPTLSFSGVSTIGLQSNGALFLQPAGTGAIQAQATTSTTVGGNVRGANAVDWQTLRTAASQVASGQYAVIGGGYANSATTTYATVCSGLANTASNLVSVVAGGQSNNASGYLSFVGGGISNIAGNRDLSVVVGGQSNNALGYFNFIGGGFTNSGTANAAVTTQSGTMNATTAVTLSGSNASIKVGQYITGTSIAADTYVAAISGTALTLSKVASGSSTSTLSFFTPHGVVVGGGNNQATGAYSAILGGGDAGTAANRNVASGDWSTVSGGWKNTASGLLSTVAGGTNNTASGIGSFIGGGGTYGSITLISGNTASGLASFVGSGFSNISSSNGSFVGAGAVNTSNGLYSAVIAGSNGTTRSIWGNHVVPALNPFSSPQGSCQSATLVIGKQTTDATATALTGDGGAASTTNQVILPNNSAYLFKATVISGVTGGGNTSGWKLEGVIKRGANAASTAIVGTVTTTLLAQDAGASGWVIAATADTTNGGLRITFTGQASTTIRTVCKVETTEMTY